MRVYIIIFSFLVSCFCGLNSQTSDVQISGSYTPAVIGQPGTSTLEVLFSNNDFIDVPVGEVWVQVSFPVSIYGPSSGPSGPLAAYFNFTETSPGTWFSFNTAPIPPLTDPTFIGQLIFTVNSVSANDVPTNTLLDTDFDTLTDVLPANNNATAGLTVSSVLPVQFSLFEARNDECETVDLDWQTLSEYNSSGFEIERSVNDGRFEKLGFVKSKAFTGRALDYNFVDKISPELNGSTLYYRLKQLDNDGRFEYSDIVSVVPSCDILRSISLSPNPAINTVNLEFLGGVSDNFKVKVISAQGQLVFDHEYQKASQVNLDVSNFSPGVYTLVLEEKGYTVSEKFIKLR